MFALPDNGNAGTDRVESTIALSPILLISYKQVSPWIFFQGLIVFLAFSCGDQANSSVDRAYPFEPRNSLGRNVEIQIVDTFFLHKDSIEHMYFSRLGEIDGRPVFYGINKYTSKVEIFFLDKYQKITIPIINGFSFSPHFSISIDDDLLMISNGYEFGAIIYDLNGELIWSGLKKSILLPDEKYVVVSHYDLNDTHLINKKYIAYRVTYPNMADHELEFYKNPVYLLKERKASTDKILPRFYFPEEYLKEKYHSRDFAISAVLNEKDELIVSIPRDTCLYVVGNTSQFRIQANCGYYEQPKLTDRVYSLSDMKRSVHEDGFYTYLLRNNSTKELYRVYKHPSTDSTYSTPYCFTIVVLDSNFDLIGETKTICNNSITLQNTGCHKRGLLARGISTNEQENSIPFYYLRFSS